MRPRQLAIACAALLLSFVLVAGRPVSRAAPAPPLWRLYDETLARARYVDLTHAVSPHIPEWAKAWPSPPLATRTRCPGVSLAALKFLHLERHILFHGHEPLDTDTTPNLEGESWLMHHGYTQAEGVANLDQVPEAGALVAIGFPKFQGGTGGYARYIAICPPDWKYGVSVGQTQEAPLPRMSEKLG